MAQGQGRPEVFGSSASAEASETKPAAPAVQRRDTSDTVTVACKHPSGYILRLHVNKPAQEMTPTGNRDIPGGVWEPSGEPPVTINGNGINISLMKKGIPPEHAMVGGYALTPNVPRAFWEEWCRQNKAHPALKNGLLFAHGDDASVRAQASDGAKIRSGLEPIDPDNPGATTGMRGAELIERGERV